MRRVSLDVARTQRLTLLARARHETLRPAACCLPALRFAEHLAMSRHPETLASPMHVLYEDSVCPLWGARKLAS